MVGPFNYYLRALGIPARPWLADPQTAMWAIIGTTVWWVTGYYLVVYLAGCHKLAGAITGDDFAELIEQEHDGKPEQPAEKGVSDSE